MWPPWGYTVAVRKLRRLGWLSVEKQSGRTRRHADAIGAVPRPNRAIRVPNHMAAFVRYNYSVRSYFVQWCSYFVQWCSYLCTMVQYTWIYTATFFQL